MTSLYSPCNHHYTTPVTLVYACFTRVNTAMQNAFHRDIYSTCPNVERAVKAIYDKYHDQKRQSWIQDSRLLNAMAWRTNLIEGGLDFASALSSAVDGIKTMEKRYPQREARIRKGKKNLFSALQVRVTVAIVDV